MLLFNVTNIAFLFDAFKNILSHGAALFTEAVQVQYFNERAGPLSYAAEVRFGYRKK